MAASPAPLPHAGGHCGFSLPIMLRSVWKYSWRDDCSLVVVKQIPGNLTTDNDTEREENKDSASLFLKKVTVCECRLLITGHCWPLLLNLDLPLRRNKGPAEALTLGATLSSLLISSQAAIFSQISVSTPDYSLGLQPYFTSPVLET